ncbi:MAG: nickel-dependent lactate racemase [Oscillospiraceae bacterium]|nr:nickel-dependent lactate racemase [Oscillospiraceae bacterium]
MAGGAVANGNVGRLIGERALPEFYLIRQKFDDTHIDDIPAAISAAVERPGTLDRINAGQRVAIAVGSRGINNISLIVRTVASLIKGRGAAPFVVPAMGSHGGATAEGQAQLLADYGVTEQNIGCPVISDMTTVTLGRTQRGVDVFFDKNAYGADAVVLLNRIKPHTDFRGLYESGLTKQIVIGLGKQDGAEACHSRPVADMSANIRDIAEIALAKTSIVFGLAIVENAYDRTMSISALPSGCILDEEPALLSVARRHMPSILLSPFDVLVIDEIGKDISGAGMDPNISGRFVTDCASGGADAQRCVVLDITDQSHGNGIGLGVADFSVTRVFDKFDFETVYPNVITNALPASGKLPVILANDLQAIRAAVKTCRMIDHDSPAIVRIKNTLHMEYMYVSEALAARAREHASIDVVGGPRALNFDSAGNIDFNVWDNVL